MASPSSLANDGERRVVLSDLEPFLPPGGAGDGRLPRALHGARDISALTDHRRS